MADAGLTLSGEAPGVGGGVGGQGVRAGAEVRIWPESPDWRSAATIIAVRPSSARRVRDTPMPKNVLTYKCMVISPSDVDAERDAVEEAIEEWNRTSGYTLDVRIHCVRWENDARPDLSEAPQDAINKQLVDDSDMGIAIFWHRLGTPTGRYPSGSVEEIERFLAKKSNIMVYFCQRNIPKAKLDPEQISALRRVERSFQGKGILGSFKTARELSSRVKQDLTGFMMSLKAKTPPIIPMSQGKNLDTAPWPDVRVMVSSEVQKRPGYSIRPTFTIKVQNHSSAVCRLARLFIVVSDGTSFRFDWDAWGDAVRFPIAIASGDSYEVTVSALLLKNSLGNREPLHILAVDKVDREFKSAPEELKSALEATLDEWSRLEAAGDTTKSKTPHQ